MRHLLTLGLVAALAAPAAAQPKPAVVVNDQIVTRAIAGAVKYLYGIANKEGHWDRPGKAPDLTLGRQDRPGPLRPGHGRGAERPAFQEGAGLADEAGDG